MSHSCLFVSSSKIFHTLVNSSVIILGIQAGVASHKFDVSNYHVCRGVELGKVLAKQVCV